VVPDHLRDGHYAGAAKLVHAHGYKYAHDYGGWVAQQYLPDAIKNAVYYEFGQNRTEQAAREFRRRQRGE
jgi:putative ATPase